jgi:cytochrome c
MWGIMRPQALWLCLSALIAACSAAPSDAARGQGLFDQQCAMCHDASGTERKMGPGLKGLFHRERLANGKKATVENVRAQIDNGGGGMPAYRDMLDERERNDVMAYLKTL